MPFTHVYRRRVRYRECDPMGVVYHTHFLDYFEEARTEALRDLGLVYKTLEADGVMAPVIEASVRFHAPAFYDDILEIETAFEGTPLVRLPMAYTVRRAGGPAALVTGRVVLCFIDAIQRRPIEAPEVVRATFERALEREPAREA